DPATRTATIRAGMQVRAAARALRERGLGVPNLGDVDVQLLAGAIATGTHGTGRTLRNLSDMLIGGRMVTADGEVRAFDQEHDHDLLRAARVSLGTLGIFTEMTLQLSAAYRLRRQEWCTHIDACLEHLDALIARNRNFDFYWYPRSDAAKLRTWNPPEDALDDLLYASLVHDTIGWSDEVLPKERPLRFEEMEYALPAEAGVDCFQAVRARVKARHRQYVGWRVLYRTIAADDVYLSPYYGRESVTISIHQNATLPSWPYFQDIEPIFLAYGGRPHWGKKHTLGCAELQPRYPLWHRFRDIRRRLDPEGRLMSPYLYELLEDSAPCQ
ncbi:MAG TPA: D-arabinono-1,4-lactone oxidase, partial [Armatimonadota bacterium]|nr:D-arabinono-1,4-lactone oxidase [Armatimonadota bacterium]